MPIKLARWAIFSVVIALLPIFFSALSMMTRGETVGLVGGFESSIDWGELLILAAAMCAAAVGELVPTGAAAPLRKILAGGGAIVVIVLASLYFADVSAATLANQHVQTDVIRTTSLWLFGTAVVSSGSCIALAGV